MPELLLVAALLLLISMATGLARLILGPTPGNRVMGVQLLGTTGIAILLLLAQVLAMPALTDVALILALLAAVSGIAFTRQRIDGNAPE